MQSRLVRLVCFICIIRLTINLDRRAQYFVAGATVAASESETFSDDDDIETGLNEDEDEEALSEQGDLQTPRTHDDFIDEFQWDEEDESSERAQTSYPELPQTNRERQKLLTAKPPAGPVREDTPLLRKTISFSTIPHPRRQSTPSGVIRPLYLSSSEQAPRPTLPRRRSSTSSSKSGKYNYGGKSTFGQTVRANAMV